MLSTLRSSLLRSVSTNFTRHVLERGPVSSVTYPLNCSSTTGNIVIYGLDHHMSTDATAQNRELQKLEKASQNQLDKYRHIPASENKARNRYSGFATGREQTSNFKKIYFVFIAGSLVFFGLCNGMTYIFKLFNVRAAAPEVETSGDSTTGTESGQAVAEGEKKKKKANFKDKKINEYENRIRQYSTPDKVFRYFGTLKVEGEVYMTPDDFVRSITPGLKQPEGLGLDQFRKFDPKKDKLETALGQDSIFFKLGEKGLISFTDYILLLTILSTPEKQFELAFKMFDFDGNGTLEYSEYEKVQGIVRNQTPMGMRHRNHGNTGNVVSFTHSALSKYFFGEHLNQKLYYEKFHEFVHRLEYEVLKLEFNRFEPEDGKIKERQFAEILITHAGFQDAKRLRMLKRVKRKYKEEPQGINFEEYLNFSKFLKNIHDVDTALTFYNVAGASIDQATLKHVALTVSNVKLTDHVVDVVFTLFDENNDGQLSNKEFVSVMKQRMMRGLEKPKEIGFIKLINSFYKCAKNQVPSIFD